MRADQHLAMTKRRAEVLREGLGGREAGREVQLPQLLRQAAEEAPRPGFIEKDVLIWDEKRKKTEAVYQLKLQPIPERGPQGGFVKQAWQLAKGWNDLVKVH